MKGSQEEDTHQPNIVDQEHPKSLETEDPQNQPPSSSSPDQAPADPKKWGTHVMGAPAAPVAHPDNQQAAAWVAGDNQQKPYQPYIVYTPLEHPPTNNPLEPVMGMFHSWSRKAETVARNLWHNLKTGPSMSETAWGKVNLTAKAITEGGFESLFRQIFGTEPNEKLKKTFACYLSTSTGPVAGTLYLSNARIAFCSDRPLFFTAPSGQEAWSYYRVVLPLANVEIVNPVVVKETPPEKYIQVTTVDRHDFWFMGFVNYEKATHHLLTSVSDSQTAHSSVSG
ncbi:GEM-like protein 5 [Eutrema salsugineum]|nr:GEM-like protein 5 [Eutrema salsugineum]